MKENFLEQKNIIIIDNFYTNPDVLLEFANTQEYSSDRKGGHFNRTRGLCDRLDYLIPFLEKHTGMKVIKDKLWNPDSMNCSFYKINEVNASHIHHDWADWSGVLYLSKDLPASMGTQFYRHKESGDYAAFGENDLPIGMWKSDAGKVYDPRIDNDEFEPTDYVAHRYNRLVLFRGKLFHSACFPDGLTNKRLNLLLYFNVDQKL